MIAVDSKVCAMCGVEKPLAEFYARKKSRQYGSHVTECKACCLERSRSYRERFPERARAAQQRWSRNNPEKLSAMYRRSNLKRKYGISSEQYDEMLARQAGVCAICGGTDGEQRLAVDHDHVSGITRSLLCANCNRGVGLFQEDPEALRAAADYLERHKQKQG